LAFLKKTWWAFVSWSLGGIGLSVSFTLWASTYATAFSPTIDPINVTRKNTLQKVKGSLKKMIPTRAVPTAPIPVVVIDTATEKGGRIFTSIEKDFSSMSTRCGRVYEINFQLIHC
jgi:hypothetical protein